jgi:hypothetical protein
LNRGGDRCGTAAIGQSLSGLNVVIADAIYLRISAKNPLDKPEQLDLDENQ